MKNIFN